jgi:endonuclease-3
LPGPERLRAAALEIVRRLARAYGRGHAARPRPKRRDPLEELIFTVLSQNTSDVNRDRAWAEMRARYPAWDDVLRAPTARLASSIASGGLANTKAPRIRAILREVRSREGRLSLGRLRRLPDVEVRDYLRSLPGIGPKTVACVMAFALGRPALPVDTHVHRVATRLGLVDARATPERAQGRLEELIPPPQRVDAHLDLIAHGRTTCRAQSPACEACVLLDLCPSGPRFLTERTKATRRTSRRSSRSRGSSPPE